MSALVILDYDEQGIKHSSLACLNAALQLATEIDVYITGPNCTPHANQASQIQGVNQVFFHLTKMHATAESITNDLLPLAQSYEHVLTAATTFGKNCLPRLAAQLDVGQVSDVIEILDKHTFKRPIYAGNAVVTVESHDAIKVITVRGTAFEHEVKTGNSAPLIEHQVEETNPQSQVERRDCEITDRPKLTSANIVVSGGRAFANKQQFEELLHPLADKLSAAIGASRAAVDAGYISNDFQIGQTGKIVAPNLYLAVGISGAIQHLAGMIDSHIIIAINKDPECKMVQIADYSLVGDIFSLLPQLLAKL